MTAPMTNQMTATNKPAGATILGLDVGTVRIGVAVARHDVRIAQPLTTLTVGESDSMERLAALAREQQAGMFVVGWPRGLQGQSTGQTHSTEAFAERLRQVSGLPVVLQDEALTSQRAETELQQRGKPFAKADVDALAATYILEDYLENAVTASIGAEGAGHV